MPKSRPPYPPEFRRQLVALVRSGRDPEDLAREFEPTAQSIRNWCSRSQDDARVGGTGHSDPPPHVSAGGCLDADPDSHPSACAHV